MRGVTLHLHCGASRETVKKREKKGGKKIQKECDRVESLEREVSRAGQGGEGVKCAGLILLSQQQYVKVQGFIVADTE